MQKPVSIVLIGIGGYGNLYVHHLLEDNPYKGQYEIVGAVDLYPENCRYYSSLLERNVPIFTSIEDFYAEKKADLAIISTPIHLHCRHTCLALENGSHVLCEKPLSPTVEEAHHMIEKMERTGKWVQIGFNWSFTSSIQEFKSDIKEGLFGKPKQLKSIVLWPRPEDYFQRASWAGRIKDKNGDFILDSVVSNATAHFLHNMFYVLGKETDQSATLQTLKAELYRANDIENYDTCTVRIFTDEQVEILFYVSHAVKEALEPTFVYEFENATVSYSKGQPIDARFKSGEKKIYEDPENHHIQKLWTCIQKVRSHEESEICGPKAAYPHVLSINAIQESTSINPFPKELIKRTPTDKSSLIWVEGLSPILIEAYEKGVLPSEMGIDWAEKGKIISLKN